MSVKRSIAVFGFVLLLFVLGWQSWNYFRLQLEVTFAEDQTQIFGDMRQKALQADAVGAAESLEYVVNYYPSGTKQRAGSRLDKIVERERASVTHDIISYLRQKTGEDLGENPEAWLKKYEKKTNNNSLRLRAIAPLH